MGAYRSRLWVGLLLIAVATGCEGTTIGSATPSPSATPIEVHDLDIVSGQTLYVPAYSEVPFTGAGRTLEMAVTLIMHNTDLTRPIILTSVRYYSGDGELVREYLEQPRQLGALASAEFVVEPERGRGIGTNFIVEWVAEEPVYEPVVEALMLNTTGNQGVSFSSAGRVISQIE